LKLPTLTIKGAVSGVDCFALLILGPVCGLPWLF